MQVAWAWALECLGEKQLALQKLKAATEIHPSSHIFEQLGLLYGEIGRSSEAGHALQAAVAMDPKSASAHNALALWYESIYDLARAESEYEQSLVLNGKNASSQAGLLRVRAYREREAP